MTTNQTADSASTWYEATNYGSPTIKAVRVSRVTDKTIVLADVHHSNARRMKEGTYFETWEAAHAHLLEVATAKLTAARRALQLAQAQHGNVKGLRRG